MEVISKYLPTGVDLGVVVSEIQEYMNYVFSFNIC